MRNSRTSYAQLRTFHILVSHLKALSLKHKGLYMESDDKIEVEIGRYKITAELEVHIPGTRYSADILLTIINTYTGKTKNFAIEYDCLHWHRKWKDEKKNDMFVDHDINVVRIQTFNLQPIAKTLWRFIKEIYNSDDETKVMYYQLADYNDNVWTGKLFLYYR